MTVARKNPIGRLAETAIDSLKDPIGAAGKMVDQAKGTAALGRMVAEQVGGTAVAKVVGVAGAVVGKATGKASGLRETYSPEAKSPADLRPVPPVNEPAHTAEPVKVHGDPVLPPVTKQPVAKQPLTKPLVATHPAKKGATRKSPARKAATVTATPADVAKVIEEAVAEDPTTTAATPAGTAAAVAVSAPGDKLPPRQQAAAKQPAKKAPVKKAPAKKATAKAPAKKSAAKKGTPGIMEPSTVKAVASESDMLRKAAERNPEQ